MQEALLHALNFFQVNCYLVTMVTMTSKCKFDWQNGVLKDHLPRHSFCSQYCFSNSENVKNHEDTDTKTTQVQDTSAEWTSVYVSAETK